MAFDYSSPNSVSFYKISKNGENIKLFILEESGVSNERTSN
ncbi:protein of unknown function [Ruminococcaceae bacterium BL-4]|nr:protein of unknown function [Ruminococcaceae bacterium BL-4]